MKTQLILAIAILTSLSACKKNSEDKVSNAVIPQGIANVAANPANPYDSVGYWHNVILNEANECLAGKQAPNIEDVVNCISPLIGMQFNLILPASFPEKVKEIVDDQDNDFSHIFSSLPCSDRVKAYLDSLINIISDTTDTKNVASFNTIKNRIVVFEDFVLQTPLLNTQERKVILEATSVARYSSFYWIQIPPAPVPKIYAAAKLFKSIVRWVAATTSDVAGAVVAAVDGDNFGQVVSYASACSTYAGTLVTYSMPDL